MMHYKLHIENSSQISLAAIIICIPYQESFIQYDIQVCFESGHKRFFEC